MHEKKEIFILKDRRTVLIYEGKLFHRLNVGHGIPNKGSVGRGTICPKEGLSHSKWDGWTVQFYKVRQFAVDSVLQYTEAAEPVRLVRL